MSHNQPSRQNPFKRRISGDRRERSRRRRLQLETLERRNLLAGMPEMIADLAPNEFGSYPSQFVAMGGSVYFVANETQLWKANPGGAGAVMVKDVGGSAVSGGQAYIAGLYNHGGTLAFGKIDRGNPMEWWDSSDDQVQLWKSNGTSSGTVLVKDFGPGSTTGVSEGTYFTALGGRIFAAVRTPEFGDELWKSDLTTGGTTIVKDIHPGTTGSYPYGNYPFNTVLHNGRLYFGADDGVHGRELWKTDGTTAGTTMVRDLSSSPTGMVGEMISVGNFLFFGFEDENPDGNIETEDGFAQLWKTDGTSGGTVLVKDFGVGSRGRGANFTNVNGTLFGTVFTPGAGRELWKSDGTGPGTVLVKDIAPGTDSSYPQNLTVFDGQLYFAAHHPDLGQELWKSNGTSSGTVLVSDIYPGEMGNIGYNSLVVRGTHLYFTADDGSVGTELWRTDGTSSGTMLVSDIRPGPEGSHPYGLRNVAGDLYFAADDGTHGNEPWILKPDPHDTIGFLRDTSTSTRVFYDWSLDANGNFLWNGVAGGDILTRDEWPSKGQPIVGDWNGDGYTDLGIFTPSVNGKSPRFSLDMNGNQQWDGSAVDRGTSFGGADSRLVPIVGDWDGDGKDEIGTWLAGVFTLDMNGNGTYEPAIDARISFGWGNAIPVVGDWNGDGITDLGFFKSGRFYLDMNGNKTWESATESFAFGGSTDMPIAGDWNGDGKDEVGYYRTIRDGAGNYLRHEFGLDMNGNFGSFQDGIDLKVSWANRADQLVAIGRWKPPVVAASLTGTVSADPPVDSSVLSGSDLQLAFDAALTLWGSAGLDSTSLSRLSQVSFSIQDLPGATLGQASGQHVVLDANGAGLGWNLITEISPSDSGSSQRYDLLTVVAHELGHVAGLDHAEDGLMAEFLRPGERKLPSAQDVDRILGAWAG